MDRSPRKPGFTEHLAPHTPGTFRSDGLQAEGKAPGYGGDAPVLSASLARSETPMAQLERTSGLVKNPGALLSGTGILKASQARCIADMTFACIKYGFEC